MSPNSGGKKPGKSGASDARGLAAAPADDRLLTVVEKDLAIKKEEIDLRRENLNHQKNLMQASMELKSKKHTENLIAAGKESSKRKVFFCVIAIAAAFFIMALAFNGQAQLAEKLLTIAGSAALGVFGGYGYAMQKSGRDRDRFND